MGARRTKKDISFLVVFGCALRFRRESGTVESTPAENTFASLNDTRHTLWKC